MKDFTVCFPYCVEAFENLAVAYIENGNGYEA